MTALRTHRQMDWKRLTVEPHKVPRRCHDRGIYGTLQPMDRPRDTTAPYFITLAVIVAGYFLWRLA